MARFQIEGFRCDCPGCPTVVEGAETIPPGWIKVEIILDPDTKVAGPNHPFTLCSDRCLYRFGRERAGVGVGRGGGRKKADA